MGASEYENSSLEELYSAYSDMLYRLAYSILLSNEDAMDAVHDVFTKYINSQCKFKSSEHQKSWFVRVTINRSHDLLRRRKVRIYTPLEEAGEIPDNATVSDSVLHIVLELDEKYKTAILLHYFENFNVEEISKILKISKSAVKMRLARGREKLKDELGKENNNV